MTSLKELLAAEGLKRRRKGPLSVDAESVAESEGYRLVSNERSIDIYEEVNSKFGGRSTERHCTWVQSQEKVRWKYSKRYNNPVYDDDRMVLSTVRGAAYCAPSLKEAAIKVLVLVLTEQVQHYATDEAFRALIRRSCAVSLARDGRLVAGIKEIIDLIERIVVSGSDSDSDSDQLNKVIIKLKEVIYDATDSRLLACADLYLGIVYKIIRKDKCSAKHLLKVFVWSPFQARTYIIPELWDRLFAPHLSHFKVWYDKEVDSLVIAPNWENRMESLHRRYDDLVDKGTRDLAMYYLRWIKGEEKGLCAIAYLHKPNYMEELFYPYRTNIPQATENQLLLRKLALETFKPQQT